MGEQNDLLESWNSTKALCITDHSITHQLSEEPSTLGVDASLFMDDEDTSPP